MNQEVLNYLLLVSPIATLAVLILGVQFQGHRLTDFRDSMSAQFRAEGAERKKDLIEMETRLSGQIDKLDVRLQRLADQRLVR